MLELFLLLLPLAAFSGWLIGRRDATEGRECNDVSMDYLQGLSFLLNDQQDKALDVFVRMLESNSEVVEIHLALGNLFRKQGEVERSIRIHQNLIARPTLKPEHRSQALYELAQDYMKAGLLDRAEKLFLEVLDKKKFTVLALRNLLDIYQQEKEWLKAIQIAERLNYLSSHNYKTIQSHFYCELADNAIRTDEFKTARLMVQKAINADKQNPRANILDGDLFLQEKRYKQALKSYHKILHFDIDYFSEVIDKITQCYIALGAEDEMIGHFMGMYKSNPDILSSSVFCNLIVSSGNEELLSQFVSRLTDVKTSDELLNVLFLISNKPELIVDNMDKIITSTNSIIENSTPYKCTNCGFKAKSIHWNCPGCHQWGCVKASLNTEVSLAH